MSGPLRVVIADDDADVLVCLRFCLEKLGHEVVAVASGKALVEACRDSVPGLVITDVDMPGMDGIDAVAAIRTFCTVPVILISGSWNSQQQERAAAMGIVECLAKPFRPLELVVAIEASLRRKSGFCDADGG